MQNEANPIPFKKTARCACSESKLTVLSKPLARFKCHCTVCQKLYNKAYAEFIVIHAKHLQLDKSEHITFGKYRRPPALKRGICTQCHTPIVAFLRLAPFLKLAFIPTERFSDLSKLPEAQAHIFYHRRSSDIDDELPKISGYWKSEFVVSQSVIKGLFRF